MADNEFESPTSKEDKFPAHMQSLDSVATLMEQLTPEERKQIAPVYKDTIDAVMDKHKDDLLKSSDAIRSFAAPVLKMLALLPHEAQMGVKASVSQLIGDTGLRDRSLKAMNPLSSELGPSATEVLESAGAPPGMGTSAVGLGLDLASSAPMLALKGARALPQLAKEIPAGIETIAPALKRIAAEGPKAYGGIKESLKGLLRGWKASKPYEERAMQAARDPSTLDYFMGEAAPQAMGALGAKIFALSPELKEANKQAAKFGQSQKPSEVMRESGMWGMNLPEQAQAGINTRAAMEGLSTDMATGKMGKFIPVEQVTKPVFNEIRDFTRKLGNAKVAEKVEATVLKEITEKYPQGTKLDLNEVANIRRKAWSMLDDTGYFEGIAMKPSPLRQVTRAQEADLLEKSSSALGKGAANIQEDVLNTVFAGADAPHPQIGSAIRKQGQEQQALITAKGALTKGAQKTLGDKIKELLPTAGAGAAIGAVGRMTGTDLLPLAMGLPVVAGALRNPAVSTTLGTAVGKFGPNAARLGLPALREYMQLSNLPPREQRQQGSLLLKKIKQWEEKP